MCGRTGEPGYPADRFFYIFFMRYFFGRADLRDHEVPGVTAGRAGHGPQYTDTSGRDPRATLEKYTGAPGQGEIPGLYAFELVNELSDLPDHRIVVVEADKDPAV